MAPRHDFDDPGAAPLPKYDFDAMSDFEVEELIRRGPGKALDDAIEALQLGVQNEQRLRKIVADGIRLGAALAKKALAG